MVELDLFACASCWGCGGGIGDVEELAGWAAVAAEREVGESEAVMHMLQKWVD